MIKNYHTLTINSLLKGPPLNVLFIYESNLQKNSLLKDVINLSTLHQKQIIYIDTFSTFFQLEVKPRDLIVISPFEMTLHQFFSMIMCLPKNSIIVVDSYPSIINVFFGEEEKADRLFLYFLIKIKHVSHLIVLVHVNSRKDLPSFPIFNKKFYDKFLLGKVD